MQILKSEIDSAQNFAYNQAAADMYSQHAQTGQLPMNPYQTNPFLVQTPNPIAAVGDYLTQNRPTQRQNLMQMPGGMEVLRSLQMAQGPQVSPKAFENMAFQQYQQTGSLPKPQGYSSQVNRDLTSPYYGIDEQVFRDPKFMALRERFPEQAAGLYRELTGIDYNTAVRSIAANQKNREGYSDALMRDLQGQLVRDDQDQLSRRISRMDSYGNVIEGTSQLTPEQRSFIDSGEFQRRSGAQIPPAMLPQGKQFPDNDVRAKYLAALKKAQMDVPNNPEYARRAAEKAITPTPGFLDRAGTTMKQNLDLARRGVERHGVLGTLGENIGNFSSEVFATLQNFGRGIGRNYEAAYSLVPPWMKTDIHDIPLRER